MADLDELESAVEPGEAMRYHDELRRGRRVGVTDERLLVLTDSDAISVPFENVEEVTFQRLDWFLVVMSTLLVGFGVYSLGRDALVGGAFALAGLASLYLTYRKRGEVLVNIGTRAKPLKFYPVDPDSFERALARALERRRTHLDAKGESPD